MPWSLNEVQFPKELRPRSSSTPWPTATSLNEVQFPKELRHDGVACFQSSEYPGLNEVQFPKELRPRMPDATAWFTEPQ